jgi:Flp pilus assembly protein TadD
MNSNDPSIRYHLAYTLDKLNRKPEAKRELQQALAMDIAFPQSQAAQALLDSL